MIKKIAFVETGAPDFHIYSFSKIPRLGLPIIATLIKKKGYEVNVFNQGLTKVNIRELLQYDFVAFSTIISTTNEAYRLSSILRRRGILTAIGGPHVTFTADEALKHCDFVFRGEGDFSFLEFLGAYNNARDFSSVSGLSYSVGGKTIHNPIKSFVKNLDDIPMPDFRLIKGHEKISCIPVNTSRGCPFGCTFCSVTKMFGRGYRTKSIKNVIETIKKYKDKYIFFIDDNFSASRKRTKELLKQMIKENAIPKWWSAQVRADIIKDRELLKLMKKTKCKYVYIGFESTNPDSLREMKKEQSVEDIENTVSILHSYSIKVHGMFIFGFDSDTIQTIRKSVQFAIKKKIDTVQFIILTPFPGTEQYDKFANEERIITKDWNLYDGHHVVFEPKNMTAYQLQTETIRAMLNFYSIKQTFKQLFIFKWLNSIMRFYGNVYLKKWVHSRANMKYISVLKKLSAFEKMKNKYFTELDNIRKKKKDSYMRLYGNLLTNFDSFKKRMLEEYDYAYGKFKLWEDKQLKHISQKKFPAPT